MPLSILPVNLDDLLRCRGVESERVEFKASWDPASTGPQVLRTICAFANDYHNLNGGYVVVGVAERDGAAALPPAGLSPEQADAAQRWIRGNCNRLDPPYAPVLSPELVDDRLVLVVWAPASDMRPHRAPRGGRGTEARYWIRLGSETVDAERRGALLRGLIDQTARVPWDDRAARTARVEDMREVKVREFLRDVRSGLLDDPDARDVYRRLRIVTRINGREIPRNVGLLFFSDDPAAWFPAARIELVQFAADRAGDVQEERVFGGSLLDQVRGSLAHLENLSVFHRQKQRDDVHARTWTAYPVAALREALVNAVYHRSYDVDQLEPTKVHLFPSRVEIVSYPGPVPGIRPAHLLPGAKVLRALPARNRRIGEFLKELRLAEGRLSGLPKICEAMARNGSPPPSFDFDEGRTWFQATLPAHPQYAALSAARDAAHLRAVGARHDASRRLETALAENRRSPDAPKMLHELAAMRTGDDGGSPPPVSWGVDSCPAGWFYVALDASGAWCCGVVDRLRDIVEQADAADRVCVDIPIGLPDKGKPEPRACDLEARAKLRDRPDDPRDPASSRPSDLEAWAKPGPSSVFPAPTREALVFDIEEAAVRTARELVDKYYRVACQRNREATAARVGGAVGLSQQTFLIIPKIRDADDLLRESDKARRIVLEVHPELCFWALNSEAVMRHGKKASGGRGRRERLEVLEACWPGAKATADEIGRLFRRGDVAWNDIVDAMAAAATGRANPLNSLPARPPADSVGLPMRMVWARREAVRIGSGRRVARALADEGA